MPTTLYIKNMVCDRCIMVVKQILTNCGLSVEQVVLGQATLAEKPNEQQLQQVGKELSKVGFELLDDKNRQIVERIKNEIVRLVYDDDTHLKTKLSNHLASLLNYDYSALSKLFSEQTGITIEKFHIMQKIERVKELLSYGELTLNEIAVKMDYSSIAYLSAQFKSITGQTPSQYKANKQSQRKSIDHI